MWPETKASAVHRHQVLCGISSLSTAVGDLFSLRLHVNKQKGTMLQLPSVALAGFVSASALMYSGSSQMH